LSKSDSRKIGVCLRITKNIDISKKKHNTKLMSELGEGRPRPAANDNEAKPAAESSQPNESWIKRKVKSVTRKLQQFRPSEISRRLEIRSTLSSDPEEPTPSLTPEQIHDQQIPYPPMPPAEKEKIHPDIRELNELFKEKFENSAIKVNGKFTKHEAVAHATAFVATDAPPYNQWKHTLPNGTKWEVIDTPITGIMIRRRTGEFGELVKFSNLYSGNFQVEYLYGGLNSKDNPYQGQDTGLKSDKGQVRDNEVAVEMVKRVINAIPQVEEK
jgi:hypothetical protein